MGCCCDVVVYFFDLSLLQFNLRSREVHPLLLLESLLMDMDATCSFRGMMECLQAPIGTLNVSPGFQQFTLASCCFEVFMLLFMVAHASSGDESSGEGLGSLPSKERSVSFRVSRFNWMQFLTGCN